MEPYLYQRVEETAGGRVQALKMYKLYRAAKGYKRTGRLRNSRIRNELSIKTGWEVVDNICEKKIYKPGSSGHLERPWTLHIRHITREENSKVFRRQCWVTSGIRLNSCIRKGYLALRNHFKLQTFGKNLAHVSSERLAMDLEKLDIRQL